MEKITILENVKSVDNYELRYRFAVPIPEKFVDLADKTSMVNSYRSLYKDLDCIVDGCVLFNRAKTFEYSQSVEDVKTYILMEYMTYSNNLENLEIQAPDELNGLVWNGNDWI